MGFFGILFTATYLLSLTLMLVYWFKSNRS